MKVLVAYYSRDGATRKAAESIAGILKCDIEEIIDTRNRKGLWGFMTGGFDAQFKKLTVIQEMKKDASAYDLVVIGTPIWSSKMVPAIRTYIIQNVKKMKNIAIFCCFGGYGDKKTFNDIETLCEKRAASKASFKRNEVKTGEFIQKAKEFAGEIQNREAI
ncbi:MAG: hypothetical protein NTZ10_02105 [Candidatus Saganbacteria bacterium]|nr:hypothetical protein [Candidatus Saganbacteria bacterium]